MSNTTLLLSAAISALTALLYLYVGHVLRKRRVSTDARLAQSMFILWWQSLGGLGLLSAGVLVLYTVGSLEIWVYQAYITFVLLVLFLALWGLQFYLVYLYTGSRRSFAPLGVFYAMLFLATLGLIEYIGAPERLVDDGWSIKAEPTTEFGLAFNLVFVLLIVGPQIVAAIAYARLYRKTSDKTQRYRIGMVSTSIIVWFGSSVLGTAASVSQGVTWQLFSRAISTAGVLVILMAYKPPAWVRRRYGIRSITEEVPSATWSDPNAPPRREGDL